MTEDEVEEGAPDIDHAPTSQHLAFVLEADFTNFSYTVCYLHLSVISTKIVSVIPIVETEGKT